MNKQYILYIDSGIGGLTTLSEAIFKNNYNFIYYADNKNSPYGSHSSSEITLFLSIIIDNLSKTYNIKYVVFACNTATTSAIDKLRAKYSNIVFIGTEPAIKLAQQKGYNSALCVATPTTIKQEKFKQLIKSSNITINQYAPKKLAPNIDEYILKNTLKSKVYILKYIYNIINKSKHSDCIILGCTHYIYLKNKLQQLTTKEILDGNIGLTNYLCSKLEKNDKQLINNSKNSSVKFLFSDNFNGQKEKYIKILKQILAKNHFIW